MACSLLEDRNGRSAWSYVVARAEEGEWREYYQWVAEKLRPWI